MSSIEHLACASLLLIAVSAAAEPVRSVHDGDTLTLESGERVRLNGIDAVELHQPCTGPNGREYRCGVLAAEHLRRLVAGADVRCEAHGRDRYRRTIATCWAGSVDLGREMVRSGWAVAYRRYSRAYVVDENEARRAGRGIWGGTFVPPEEWRHR